MKTTGLAGLIFAAATLASGAETLQTEPATIRALSTEAAHVTAGDVLLEVTAPPGTAILAGDRDITAAFRKDQTSGKLAGLVTGLPLGKTLIRAAGASLEITNYPVTGPMISGPWQQPFICQTAEFKLPDGTMLGKPLDANCSVKTVIQYVYMPAGGKDSKDFKALRDPLAPPADVATTTTSEGQSVKFIVRVETGTMNRGIYQNAILHDPATDPLPTPAAPPRGWNHRLIAIHGSGCAGGWYIQGAAMGVNPLDKERLGQGYALFVNTLNHPTNSCNAVVAGETAMMGKEHFIETFGVPFYTISTGGSGGAYTSLQIADAFPGLFDGVYIRATFPDALAIAMSGLDAHLLMHYFSVTNPSGLTEVQKVAVGGYAGMQAMIDAANQSQRTDPVPNRADLEGYLSARWNKAVPANLHYDPATNPKGARPTVFDAARNVYGVNPVTGAALRPFDNTGIQYGLSALNGGLITAAEFIDLNEKIGGVDADGNYTPARSHADEAALGRAYQSGLMLNGKGGLASIPIFDNATSKETGGYHYGWFHFALRDRLRRANGDSANMVMWRSVPDEKTGQDLFDRWMTTYKSDKSAEPQKTKVVKAKPSLATDGCWDNGADKHRFIAEPLTFTAQPVSDCSRLYPVSSSPRVEAGGPLAANVLKCQLKPIHPGDYRAAFTDAEMGRLRAAFPGGVCDFAKPGVNQVPLVTWPSFGPSTENMVWDPAKH